MRYLIKAEFYKFKKGNSVCFILVVLFCCACISIFTGVYSSAENTFLNLAKDYMILILACAIYAGISLTNEFSNRTIIHIIVYGNKRFWIVISKNLHYLAGCTVIIVLYLVTTTVISIPILGMEGSLLNFIWYIFISILLSLPLYWVVIELFFLIGMAARNGVITMGISVFFSIMSVVFLNKVYSAVQAPETSLLRYLPIIQLPKIAEGSVSMSDYQITLGFSILAFFLIILASIIIINEAEL